MSNTALVQARVEPDMRDAVNSVLADNGLDIPTAIRIYFAKILRVGGIPFDVRTYNAETIAAMEEANRVSRDPHAKSYASFAELVADLDNDDDG
ncbi:MAG: type II toxin-antitoxin system RelB/DinJ family antitoxin [Coriobacteriales bacterium]|nr:type II toxin-antitoxin system RelB/DinJ family antitoxin [Coriobacteriales bacterium]